MDKKYYDILVKFITDEEPVVYTSRILIDLMCDNDVEYIMDTRTGELIYYKELI